MVNFDFVKNEKKNEHLLLNSYEFVLLIDQEFEGWRSIHEECADQVSTTENVKELAEAREIHILYYVRGCLKMFSFVYDFYVLLRAEHSWILIDVLWLWDGLLICN